MQVFADIFLGAGALGAAFYCLILARRLNRFSDLEKGVGGAVALLSSQVEDLSRTMDEARNISAGSTESLAQLTAQAEAMANRLELLMASLHDLPDADKPEEPGTAEAGDGPESAPMFTRHVRSRKEAA